MKNSKSTTIKKIHQKHQYSDYENLVFSKVEQFHKNYNNHEFLKNGALVTEDIEVRSNGTLLHGRNAFIERIQRFKPFFPDTRINDKAIYVDGNVAIIELEVEGTLHTDFTTPYGLIKANGQKIKVEGVEIFTFNENAQVHSLITIQRLDQLYDQLNKK